MNFVIPAAAVVAGLAIMVFSSDRFVRGAARVAEYFGISPLVVGMVIIGFGTSAPEMLVSALSAVSGKPELALGNAYGSNITNIALILGISGLINPVIVQPSCIRRDLPLLAAATLLSAVLIYDFLQPGEPSLSRLNALTLLAVFGGIMYLTARGSKKDTLPENTAPVSAADAPAAENAPAAPENETGAPSLRWAVCWVAAGLVLLVGSSYLLVWGAVKIAAALGVSSLIIGLTVVAVGTSLPELASSVAAARLNQHELAIGNILGSNLFNTLAVVGIAGALKPFKIAPEVLTRDYPVMFILLIILFFCGIKWPGRSQGRISRIDGVLLLLLYIAYNTWLIIDAKGGL